MTISPPQSGIKHPAERTAKPNPFPTTPLSQTHPTIPRHVAVIMDGNGRWAKKRGLPRIKGHDAGSKAVGQCLEACQEAGVDFLTLYAFSSENWKRPVDEVNGLMRLLEHFLIERTQEIIEKNVRLLTIGRTHELPERIQKLLRDSIRSSEANTGLTVILALNYSSRVEIVDSVKNLVAQAAAGTLKPDDVTADLISQSLYTAGIPDPDLLVRTSGELRLSNFLLWQLSYTELYITPKLWPDFTKADFFEALREYASRSRRYGGV